MKNKENNDDMAMQIESGTDSDLLIIAFSGFGHQLLLPAYDFLAVAKLLRYTHIFLKDVTKTCFFAGLPPLAANSGELIELLKKNINEISPKKVMCIGTSGGGTAALLFGHKLKVDYIHAFSPYTYVDEKNISRYRDTELLKRKDARERILALDLPGEFLDLKQLLDVPNGKSRYYIHVCRDSKRDMARAQHVSKCPDVAVFTYQCDSHSIPTYLAREKLLSKLLRIENQDMLAERAEKIKRSRIHKAN